MSQCIDCPDLPNGVHKRQICCRREGALLVQDRNDEKPVRKARGRGVTVRVSPSFRRAVEAAKPQIKRVVQRAIREALKRG